MRIIEPSPEAAAQFRQRARPALRAARAKLLEHATHDRSIGFLIYEIDAALSIARTQIEKEEPHEPS